MAKDGKKGGGGKAAGGFVVGAAAAVAVMYFLKGNFGFGQSGSGEAKKEETSPAASVSVTQEAEPAVTEIKYVDVTIKEDKYVYNGGEYGLDELMTELEKLTGGENVRINDDKGLAETLDGLKKALDGKGIKYLDETNIAS